MLNAANYGVEELSLDAARATFGGDLWPITRDLAALIGEIGDAISSSGGDGTVSTVGGMKYSGGFQM